MVIKKQLSTKFVGQQMIKYRSKFFIIIKCISQVHAANFCFVLAAIKLTTDPHYEKTK